MARGGNSYLSNNFIGLEVGQIYKFDNKVKNLIKSIYSSFTKISCGITLTDNIFTITSTTTSDCGLGNTSTDILEIGKTYTIGYKLKINSSLSSNNVCRERIMICNKGSWYPSYYGINKNVVSDGTEWIDIRYVFTNTNLTSINLLLGTSGYMGANYYIKEPFLVEGDYTNKKLPSSL